MSDMLIAIECNDSWAFVFDRCILNGGQVLIDVNWLIIEVMRPYLDYVTLYTI